MCYHNFVGQLFTSLQSSSVSTLSNDVGSVCDSWTNPFVQTKNKVCVSGATAAFKMCTVSNYSYYQIVLSEPRNQETSPVLVCPSNDNLSKL